MEFLKIRNHNGNEVFVNPANIVGIAPATQKDIEGLPGVAGFLILSTGDHVATQHTQDEIIAALRPTVTQVG